jgi:gliding motility-associated-like protein
MRRINLLIFLVAIINQSFFSQVNIPIDFENEFVGSANWQVFVPNGNYDNNWCIDQTIYSISGKSAQICAPNGSTNDAGYNFSNNTNSPILAKKFNALNHFNLVLKFDWRCNGEENIDYGVVHYSQDNGNTWVVLKSNIRNGAPNPNQPAIEYVTLPKCLDNTQFHIGFSFVADKSFNFQPGFVIDNLELQGNYCSSYPVPPTNPNNPTVCFDYQNPIQLLLNTSSSSLRWYNQPGCGDQFHQGNELWKLPLESVTYYVTSINEVTGCESQSKTPITLTVKTRPNIFIDSIIPTTYGGDGKIVISATGFAPFYYQWCYLPDTTLLPFNGTTFANIEAGDYKLRVLDSQFPQCDSIVYLNVPEGSELKIPSAISPGTDGLNDIWEIIGIYQIEDFKLEIFDLTGNMVYAQYGSKTNGAYTPFAGKNNNEVEIPDGDYIYSIQSKIKDRRFRGILTIKRK